MPSPSAPTGLAARTVRGLEWVAAEEIAASVPGVAGIEMTARQVNFTVGGPDALHAALALRTVDDVLLRVASVRGVSGSRRAPAALAAGAARVNLQDALHAVLAVRALPARPALDVVASLGGDRSYNRYDVEDAVAAELAPRLGLRYASRRQGPVGPSDISIRVAMNGDRAELMVRLAGRPLHRRPWKLATGVGSLHPPAAAALLRMAGVAQWVADPCCGDGTLVVEAARRYATARVLGADIDEGRVGHARHNAHAAGVEAALIVSDAAGLAWRRPGPAGLVATNPPWNRTVDAAGGLATSLQPLWRSAAEVIGGRGRLALVLDGDLDPTADLRVLGFAPVVTQQVRLVGRVAQLMVLATGGPADRPSPWRERAVREGIITASGF